MKVVHMERNIFH